MSEKLRIYACSGIGAVKNEYDYWLDNTSTVSNTQAVNSLLAKINLAYTEAMYLQLNEEEIAERLDLIDQYSVCLYFAQKYQDNSEELYAAGRVVGSMLKSGAFISNSLDNQERDANLDALIVRAESMMDGANLEANPEFVDWWQENIIAKNIVGLSEEEQEAIENTLQSQSVNGYEENPDLAKYLNNAGEYFAYTYFTKEQLSKLPYVFTRKAKTQNNVYQYCKALYVKSYGTEAEMRDVIRTGIIQYSGDTPENFCKGVYDNFMKGEAVGGAPIVWTAKAIVELVLGIISAVISILGLILTCVAQVKVAEIQQVDAASANAACPNESDYPAEWGKDDKKSSMLWLGIAAVAALFLIGKK